MMTGTSFLFQNGSNLFLALIQDSEYLDQDFEIKENVFIPRGKHRFSQLMAFYESDKSKDISYRGEIDVGRFYNGSLFRTNVSGVLKLSGRCQVECIYDRIRFNLPVTGGKFTTNIAALRVIYSFAPNLFAKAYLQWNDEENLFLGNFLIRWIYKPGANIYFIYNETRKPGREGYLRDRALILKVNLLFNL
jgi:hypothetical protein